jgi:hypothetical protein
MARLNEASDPNLTWGSAFGFHPRLYSDARSTGLRNTKQLSLQRN